MSWLKKPFDNYVQGNPNLYNTHGKFERFEPVKIEFSNRVQRSLIFHPALRASCGQDILAWGSFLLARKFLMFYSAPIN